MKNIRLVYSGNNQKILKAVDKTNSIFADPEFYRAIASYQEFEASCASPAVISRIMCESDHCIEVHSSRIVSLLKGNGFDRFYFSESFKDLATGMIVNQLTQQTVMAMDKLYGFSKKGFRNAGIRTACLIIAAIAQSMVNNLPEKTENSTQNRELAGGALR